ncbi:beta-glucosidase family protein [Allorhizocola rhizosphaerae]|uniref:beta-glucosidase family protein n=1 Tax=Allorhizocola rhizosphaerae TaxID=1872709 RepID=UPI000E3C4FCA|nr:glycoside hydrolase family 3 C-terminal domain-containing protein [Allorhizocola rhizosphaerae]
MRFRDESLPVPERVADLLARLTLDEKLGLLHQHQAPIERLGIGVFRTGTEALHGLAWLGEATVFPQAIGLGATWDPDLVQRVGQATGDEVRVHPEAGLNVWAPVVNPLRDPRWGRNEEGYSEDPWLTGKMGQAYSQGLRGDDPDRLKTAPTLKHFLGYNNETDRCLSSSNLSPRVLHEYEFPAYRPAIESGAAVAVMASYNLVNGIPAHVSPLINEHLRTWTDQELFIVSDAYAPNNLADPELQAYFADHATSHAAALRAGIDSFTDQDDRAHITIGRFREAFDRGLLSEEDIDRAVRRALTLRMRLGEFDAQPLEVESENHDELALEAAQRSIVLLKNEAGVLPLRGRIGVIGPLADQVMTDWYSGTPPYRHTIRSGLSPAGFCEGVDRIALVQEDGTHLVDPQGFDVFDWGRDDVLVFRSVSTGQYLTIKDDVLLADSPGPHAWDVHETFRLVQTGDGWARLYHVFSKSFVGGRLRVELLHDGAAQAASLASEVDVAVVVLGNHPMVNGRETEDRVDLALPRAQERLLRAVHAANPRTVLVITSSYPYAIEWACQHVPAIVWSSHGGQELGRAMASVLRGQAEPAGRLPQTWYRSHTELPDIFDYDIIANDATYMYHLGSPLFPFGHGLSWGEFEYANLRVDGDHVTVEITNVGDRPGEEVAQLYTRQLRSRVKQPLRRLRDFARVRLEPGETATVKLHIGDLSFWDVTSGRFVVEKSDHRLMVGRSATDIRCGVTHSVDGVEIGPRPGDVIRAIDFDESFGVELVAGDAVVSTEKGAWLRFGLTDLTGRTEAILPDGVVVRAGDPLDGRFESGVVDLYLVFEAPGVKVQQVEFR